MYILLFYNKYIIHIMSYIGTKIFCGICVNIYASVCFINIQNEWLNNRLIEERKLIIAGLKSDKR